MMQGTAKTIQIFLPSGDPRGLRIAEVTTRIVRVIEVPRSLLDEFLVLPEANQVGLYFLVGGGDDAEAPQLYIGQTGSLKERLASHHKSKDFWTRAMIVLSLTNSLTQTHALFLEWQSIKLATEAGRYTLENGTAGTRPYTPAPLEADCIEVFETAKTLLATLGQPIFEPLAGTSGRTGNRELYYCRSSDADGTGEYTEEGFVVLKGSSGRRLGVKSFQGGAHERLRERLIESGVLKVEGDRVIFTKDHLFNTPSTAAVMVMGRHANGWAEWKDQNGQTLDALKRR